MEWWQWDVGTMLGLVKVTVTKWVVATLIFFIFPPEPWEIFQFHEHMFQMGWNHLDNAFINYPLVSFGKWCQYDTDDKDN